jgi:tetratricopeptide (TPR) repeat protein
LYERARSHASLGEPAEALECLTRAIELDPAFAEAHSFRGTILLQEGRRAESIIAFKSALAANPKDGDAQVLLASALHATGDVRQAKWWLERTLELERPAAHEGLVRARYADVLLELGSAGAAIEQLERAIGLMGNGVPPDVIGRAHRSMGDAFARAGRLDDAVEAWNAAIDTAGPDVDAYNALGLTQLQLGHLEAARDTFRTAIEHAPDSAGLAFNLTCVLCAMGDADAAFDSLQRALELDPDLRQAARTDADLASLREADAARFARLTG